MNRESRFQIPAALDLVEKADKASTAEEVRIRALKALAQEARMMLDEGVVATPAEIDLCMLLGAGWPMHLGGILPYLDREGISEVGLRSALSCARELHRFLLVEAPARLMLGVTSSAHVIPRSSKISRALGMLDELQAEHRWNAVQRNHCSCIAEQLLIMSWRFRHGWIPSSRTTTLLYNVRASEVNELN
jgi:hypothetical protein